ncbi:MAG: FIST N-terminal domain-containing protein [bacterium]
MPELSIGFSRSPRPEQAAEELARALEQAFAGGSAVTGGLLLATAAAGSQGVEVGRILAARWPQAELLGTSFEGLVAHGELWRDRPALVLCAWSEAIGSPAPFAMEPGERDPARIAHEILSAADCSVLGPEDLVLLFPDAGAGLPIGILLRELEPLLGDASIAGAAASGSSGEPVPAWLDEEEAKGSLVGIVFPSPRPRQQPGPEGVASRVATASASRASSPWLTVTRCSGHWVERIEGERALDWVRGQLGLGRRAPLERPLERLLVRVRRPTEPRDGSRRPSKPDAGARGAEPRVDADADGEAADASGEVWEERFVIGVDERAGSFSLPVPILSGDELAFSLPDPTRARSALREGIEGLERTAGLIHFGCRTRDASLHGGEELEPALLAHLARDRAVFGTIGPLQIGPDASRRTRLLVHATVLAALGSSGRDSDR